MRQLIGGLMVAALTAAAPVAPVSHELAAAVAAKTRTPANVARDRYRHPAETLAFFGVKPTDTVVEWTPGGGWFTEILAPLVKGRGHYIAVLGAKSADDFRAKLAAKQSSYGATTVAVVDTAAGTVPIAPSSVDVVLTFRNVHNLVMDDDPTLAAKVFAADFRMLKPGGTLGIEDHRLPETMDSALEKTSGYLKRSTVVRLATAAGFKLAGESAINANPRDDHDHPKGVWTLPPTYELKDIDHAKYEAIGESDRMTLKFVKPR